MNGGRLAWRWKSDLRAEQLVDGAIRLVDRSIRVRAGRRVGIGNRNLADALATDDTRSFGCRRKCPGRRIEKRVVGIRITMWPAVNGNTEDISRLIESRRAQDALQLIANMVLKSFERRREHAIAANAVLLTARVARLVEIRGHPHNNRLVR